MTVYRKETLLRQHAFTSLRLIHAAFVDSFECHGHFNRMPVNRLLFVCGKSDRGKSTIRDHATNTLHEMLPEHIFFIPCNHLIDIDIAAEMPFLSLQFNLDLYYGFDVFEDYPRCETLQDSDLISELRHLLEKEEDLRTLYRINEIIFHFCVRWYQKNKALHERLSRSHHYTKILEFVQQSGDASATVEMLASLLGMRKDVFSRNFTRDMGITPKKFLSKTILRKASALLLVPDTSVADVAHQLNFSSEFYFSHFFKQHTGMAPSDFQKQNLFGCLESKRVSRCARKVAARNNPIPGRSRQ